MTFLPGFAFTAALFGLRRLDPHRGKATRRDDWLLLWALHTEIGSPPLPCTAPWCQSVQNG
jgi:hypothetical protein